MNFDIAAYPTTFLLEWQLLAGADEAVADAPSNYFLPPKPIVFDIPAQIAELQANSPVKPAIATPLHHSPSAAMLKARELANEAKTLAELEEAVRGFDGCLLKRTATKTVFADGNPNAEVMLIGEAPGAQEDVQGIPFCGASGQLLDKMLASIGITRKENTYISNTIFWRPAGNRQPTPEETAICLPFVEKHIALIAPKLLILSGGTAVRTMLGNETAISRLRGKFYEYQNEYLPAPIKTALIYHPSYLLRQPQYKKQAWQDLLMIAGELQD